MSLILSEHGENQLLLEQYKQLPRAPMHAFHRYYGKLIPAIPAAAIARYTAPDALVFDPFSGSGTVGVEALLRGRHFLGVEVNPLSQKIAHVKTRRLDPDTLRVLWSRFAALLPSVPARVTEADKPFLQNRDHWFKEPVQRDLIRLRRCIDALFSEAGGSLPDAEDYRDFFLITLSAIIRNVSNADTLHVFPGVSKRMRRLEAEGAIHTDTIATYERAVKKRIACYEDYRGGTTGAEVLAGDSTTLDLSPWYGRAALCVTNPPYISSVRYIETLKLEMYWLGEISAAAEYDVLSRRMLGNDRLHRSEYQTLPRTGYPEIDALSDEMWESSPKSAYIIGAFFQQMERAVRQIHRVLCPGGTAVIKISDSRMHGRIVETARFLTAIAERCGFTPADAFLDEINNNSRSLTLARNTYSDIITHDYILIWEKRP